jgi:glycosyltransferase involved in cell wall biosynthesis
MKIVYITAGAAGMYCGSCLHDNTLVAALLAQGHESLLVPTYTPIRTDEQDVSLQRVFLGGINVFLQQKLALFRHTPWIVDRPLDAPRLLRWASRFAVKTAPEQLGDLTVSMLEGEHGRQRKEVEKLAHWLAHDLQPEIINLTNALLAGIVHEIKDRTRARILCTLQGDDIYLEALPEPYRTKCLSLIRSHCGLIDGFIATSRYYADFMTEYFAIPRERIHVVYPGLNLAGHAGPRTSRDGQPCTIGYFARICPEKGLHVLGEAFHHLRQSPGAPPCRLRVSGWLGANQAAYLEEIKRKLAASGLGEEFEYVASPDHASKVEFIRSLDILSVPTTYREPKGLYILEALANGVPVVQPRHGSFPELVEQTGGGLLVEPDNPKDLARGLRQLAEDAGQREKLAQSGKKSVHAYFHAQRMAEETVEVYRKYLEPGARRAEVS